MLLPQFSPSQTFESIAAGLAPTQTGVAVFPGAISAGLLKPVGSLWSANSASSPPSRRWLTSGCALSNAAPVASRTTHSTEGDGRRASRMVAEVYEQKGGPKQQQERGPFPPPSVILWEEDLVNAVQLVGRVGRDMEMKYLDCGKVVATTSLAVHKASHRTEDPSWFTLEICDDLAEIALHHVAKGELILVAGQIVVDKRVKDDVRSTIVKVVVRDLCFVEHSSDRRQPFGQSNDEFTVRGSISQYQAEVASMASSQRNWYHQRLSSQPPQGIKGHGTNVAQLEAQSAQPRAGASKWRDAATLIEQKRNPSRKVVGRIKSLEQNTDSLKVDLKRVGYIGANLTRSIRANDVLDIGEPDPLAREEEVQSLPVSESEVTENSVRQDLRTGEVLRKALRLDCRSSPAWKKAGLNLIAEGRLQSRASYGTRDWSRDTVQGNGSTQMHSVGTTTEAIADLQNRLERGITTDSSRYIEILQMCLQRKDLLAVKQVHDSITKSGMDRKPYVADTLLNVYIKCGGLLDARRVFEELEKRTVIHWNSMIAGYAKNGNAESAFQLFKSMRQEGARPNNVTYLCILKACASPSALEWGKEVHVCIRHGGCESDVRVGSALVQMYAKCGCIAEAKQVFENLTNRNIVTWNIMIRAHADSGNGMEAYALFLQMKREGFEPDAFTYTSILNASASLGALEWVKKVHGHAFKAGLEADLRVGNALVRMYAKSGSRADAQEVFDRMGKRDVITWNIMIGAHAESGRGMEAYGLFLQMKREGFEPDAVTYTSILNSSASAGALEWVKKIHRHALQAGLESDLRVGSALVHMYAKSGSLDDARLVFDRMKKRNVITWTIMIGAYAECGRRMEAYGLFLQMKREGFQPDAVTYASILNASDDVEALDWVKTVHDHALEAGLESDLLVGNALVHMYVKSGSIDDARQLFDRMGKRDVITWNVIIGAHAESGRGTEAYGLFLQMRREGFEPDAATYASILNASVSAGALEWVKKIHAHALQSGLESDLRVGNSLVHMYAKSGSIPDAQEVFDRMSKRDAITWNIIIGAYAESGRGMEAYELFLQMRREGFEPGAVTYTSILNSSASAGALEWVKKIHGHALQAGLESDLRVGNSLVHMYAKSGSIDDAQQVFDKMGKRDVVTWNVMIGAHADSGRGMEAYELFLQMRREGFEPDAVTYASILNSSASAWALEWVKKIHGHALKAGVESDLRVGNALVHMYAKSGSIDDAQEVFDRMGQRDVVTWNIMIGGLAQHGRGHEALKFFRKMNADNVKPNETSLGAVLSACSHGGLVDDGRRIFSAMTQEYGVERSVVHYNLMVDILGRAGHLDEAKQLISEMPMGPDVVTWTALLGACRTYGNVEAGELAADKLFKLEPDKASTYVLLSNIYAAAGQWEKVSSVRTMMDERRVRKEAGRSWIEVDNKIHEFVVGDRSHPEAEEIYAELNKLTEKLKAAGYIPDTRLVLHDINEEDKELALCSHSEKLAIAYGLMHLPWGEPIRVYKNLRVCSDCHSATKYISKVTGREIVARDANRFHHFNDGVCSCGDYW